MLKMKTILVVACFMLGTIFFPLEKTAALSNMHLNAYHAFPMPDVKPDQCSARTEVNYEAYLGQKQAAAAALGLYFGIKHATAPQLNKEKMVPYICL